jgi:hypothetical protein
MLGERQQAAAAELAQWWDGIRRGGAGSHVVLLAGPAGWGRSTVLDELAATATRSESRGILAVRLNGKALPAEPGQQALAVRDGLLAAEVRRQAAALLCRGRLRGHGTRTPLSVSSPRGIGQRSTLLMSGMAGTVSLLLAGLAAAAGGGQPDDRPDSENGTAARAARIVSAVSASAPALVVIDDADYLDPGLAVTVIENLVDQDDSRVLVAAAVDLGSDLAAALATRAKHGRTAGRVHRADADPRMGSASRAELAAELSPHLTAAEAQQLAGQTRTFAEIFAAARPRPLS